MSACSDQVKTGEGPVARPGYGPPVEQPSPDQNNGNTNEGGRLGDECIDASDCLSELCVAQTGTEAFVCAEACEEAGAPCGMGYTCEDTTDQGLICVPPEMEIPGLGQGGGAPPVKCEIPQNRRFIYTVDHRLVIRSIDPETLEVQERGSCDLDSIHHSVMNALSDAGYPEYDFDSNLDVQRFAVSSMAVARNGRGFIAFSTLDGYPSAYGIITVPNVNSVVDCSVTVQTYEHGYPVQTLSMAKDPLNPSSEKLYANLFTENNLTMIERGDETIAPSRVIEINPEDTSDQYPLMSMQDLRLLELTQDNQGNMFSLFTEDGCHGDCREPEVGQPRPEGVSVKKFKLAAVDLNNEGLGRTYPIEVSDPFDIYCGRSFGECSYSTGHNLVFFDQNPYVFYTQSSGDLNLDNLSFYVYGYGQSRGFSKLSQLEFDPESGSYVGGDSVIIDHQILGAATVACQ